MKRITLLLGLLAISFFAFIAADSGYYQLFNARPTWAQFNADNIQTNGGLVSIKSGALITNIDVYSSLASYGSGGADTTQIGDSANASGSQSSAIGADSIASQAGAQAFGQQAASVHLSSTAVGYSSLTTADNQIMLGRSTEHVTMPGAAEVAGNFTASSGTITNALTNGVFRSTWVDLPYTDETNVLVDLSLSCAFTLTLTNTAYLIATNIPATMQTAWLEIKTGTGNNTITFSPEFSFGAAGFTTNTTNAARVDLLGMKTSNSGTNVHAFFNPNHDL